MEEELPDSIHWKKFFVDTESNRGTFMSIEGKKYIYIGIKSGSWKLSQH
jgi:rRNA maturation protein Rpf1